MRVEHFAGATLFHADSRDVIGSLGRFDATVTDPPYGLGARLQGGKKEWKLHQGGDATAVWDQETSPVLLQAVKAANYSIVWGGNYYALPPSRSWLYWDKKCPGFSSGDGELAWSNLDKPVRAFSLARNIFTPFVNGWERKEHPTQKPLRLMLWCIDQLPACETIFDPFMGSGSTGVAALQKGKVFTGIERAEKYFDIACRRIEAELKQPRLALEAAS